LLQQWKESTIIPIHKKGDKTDCNRILFNILLARLTPYMSEVTGDHQRGFFCNISTTDQIFYIWQMLQKNGSIMGQCISYLYTSRKPMTQSREKFFTIFCLNLVYIRN
jgi:hypothetical protein